MNILDEIISHKRKEVIERKNRIPIQALEQATCFSIPTISFTEHVRRKDKSGIIAEFKRKSPSKGIINGQASVQDTTRGYIAAGASALSVLTDENFFGGCSEDLTIARKGVSSPILRKDFTIDEYQIVEAKSIGADAILLIAAVLDPVQTKKLAAFAHSFGLDVLLEVHNQDELQQNLEAGADMIGVNNRDLKTFTVSTDISKKLAPLIPEGVVKVSESGISTPHDIVDLKNYGFEGFLIGENFMKHSRPETAAADFMKELYKVMAVNE
jgi:indole-3-glycerol phosphate synthase